MSHRWQRVTIQIHIRNDAEESQTAALEAEYEGRFLEMAEVKIALQVAINQLNAPLIEGTGDE